MKNKLTVTVGISAYNEESNIQYLLNRIITQKEIDFKILEIIVISDGSRDKTVDKVREIQDKRMVLFDEKERVGQNMRQNFIFKKAKGNIIVLLEADTILNDNNYLYELIKPFFTQKNISMTYGYSLPIPLKEGSFFERMLTFVETLKQKKLDTLGYDNLYLCGTGRAFSKEMSKTFYWPEDVPEDTYSFLFCKQNRLKIMFTPYAAVHFRSPVNFPDYIKKAIKFNKGQSKLKNYFPESLLSHNYKLKSSWIISLFLEGFYRKPRFMTAYLFVNLAKSILSLFFPEYNPLWEVSSSTKLLK